MQGIILLLDALDLHRLLSLCAEGSQVLREVQTKSPSQDVDTELQGWLPCATPEHGPILLAWAAAALLSQSLCPGMALYCITNCCRCTLAYVRPYMFAALLELGTYGK